ncbi:MAG: DNA-binding protein [Ruminococcaceae bacterium]|nr:DNA-binding protein [Oscillospiraceae bacterium]MBQ9692371.1 DNA-binding protein [Clostridia bacterium]
MNIDMVRLYDIYAPLLNERQREILSLYYNEDESLSEISENVGITRQGVRDCIVKSEALLCEFEAALRLREKALKFDSMINALKAEAEAKGADKSLLDKISALKDL